MKFLKLISVVIAIAAFGLFSQQVSAAALTGDLPSTTYLTSDNKDWTWASTWGNEAIGDLFEAPTFHVGWRYATSLELDYIFENLVDLFLNDGNPIVSTAYWNDYTLIVTIRDLTGGYIESGEHTMTYGPGVSVCASGASCDTFYVRDITVNNVPIPSALWLFSSGLIGLVGVARKK